MNYRKQLKAVAFATAFNGIALFLLFLFRKVVPTGILFDQIVTVSLVVFFLFSTVIFLLKKNARMAFPMNLVQLSVSSTLIFILFSTLTLVNIDRSRSFYVLAWVHQDLVSYRNGVFDLTRVNSSEAKSQSEIEQRLLEQIKRGLITTTREKIILTDRGIFVLNLSNLSATLFDLSHWERHKY